MIIVVQDKAFKLEDYIMLLTFSIVLIMDILAFNCLSIYRNKIVDKEYGIPSIEDQKEARIIYNEIVNAYCKASFDFFSEQDYENIDSFVRDIVRIISKGHKMKNDEYIALNLNDIILEIEKEGTSNIENERFKTLIVGTKRLYDNNNCPI